MKQQAIATIPGTKRVFKTDLKSATITRADGVLLRPRFVGICGTDKDVTEKDWGKTPKGERFLVLGHETLAEVIEHGDKVTDVRKGDWVVPTVRLPLKDDIYARIGHTNHTRSDFVERGISGAHGYLTERVEVSELYLAKVPQAMRSIEATLVEPMSIVANTIDLAWRLQLAKLSVWKPQNALVIGPGPIGLLAAAMLRIKGVDVTVVGRSPEDCKKADCARRIGATYYRDNSDVAHRELYYNRNSDRKFDFIFEAAGNPVLMYDSYAAVQTNGIIALTGIVENEPKIVPVDINLQGRPTKQNATVIGVVNSNVMHFDDSINHLALIETYWPGWRSSLITNTIRGFDEVALVDAFQRDKGPNDIKTIIDLGAVKN